MAWEFARIIAGVEAAAVVAAAAKESSPRRLTCYVG
jgi:hypothetical protein